MGPGEKVALHLARFVRKVGDVSSISSRHARRRASRLCRGQRWLLDADTSRQGTMGLRGIRSRQNWTDHDHGARDQGRRLQVRHAREELHGARRQEGAHTTR